MDNTNKENKVILYSADDFGKNKIANTNILKLVKNKKIDRVSVMINGEFSLTEIESLLNSNIKLDIHLDIQNKITNKWKLRDEIFTRGIIFIKDSITGKISPRKIKTLWEKQINDFKSIFCKYPDGLNSHQHIHFFPPYFKIAQELSQKYKIRYIRFGYKSFYNFNSIALILNILKTMDHVYIKKKSIISTDFMISADWIKNFDFKKHKNTLLKQKNIEIVFHPERKEEFNYLENIK